MRTIDISTTQNVTIEYELPPIRDRIFAGMIDGLIWLSGFFILVQVAMGLGFYSSAGMFTYYFIAIPFLLFYDLLSDLIGNGQSLGKRALGLKVVKLNGKSPTPSDYLIRWLFKWMEVYLTAGTLGTLVASFSPKSQRIGDMLSNTTVIKLQPQMQFTLRDILNISTLDNYEPVFTDVTAFNEQDMLLIKSVLERVRRFPNDAHLDVLDALADRVAGELGLMETPKKKVKFLKTVLSDYIVLTR